jgi:hypothetical protein
MKALAGIKRDRDGCCRCELERVDHQSLHRTTPQVSNQCDWCQIWPAITRPFPIAAELLDFFKGTA